MGEDIDRLARLLARRDRLDDGETVLADGAVQPNILVGDLTGAPVGGRGALF